MNKLNNTLRTKEHYNAPKCETHEIVPEGMICQSNGEELNTPGFFDGNSTHDNGGWM